MKKLHLNSEIRNLIILFGLLYTSILVAVFCINAVQSIEDEDFLFVSLSYEKAFADLSCVPVEAENGINIPEINIKAPLIFPENDNDLTDDLNHGVVHFPESDLPGEKGVVILLGHSAPAGWPKIKYDWVFSRLNQLESGDKIYVVFDRCRYAYGVEGKSVLNKGEDIPSRLTEGKESGLILISCWPPGKDYKRIAVEAELIEPK